MIKIINQGTYSLVKTKGPGKILTLDKAQSFAWIDNKLNKLQTRHEQSTDGNHVLSLGKYRLYEVKDEPNLTDLLHLELSAGEGLWQGYLLSDDLPQNDQNKVQIKPTKEAITLTSSKVG